MSVSVSVVGQSGWTELWSKTSLDASGNAWTASDAISLAAYAGQTIELRFRFDSVDEVENGFVGWLVDDVEFTGFTSYCNQDSIFADDFESGSLDSWSQVSG